MAENEDCRNKMPVLRRCGRVRRRLKNDDRTEKKRGRQTEKECLPRYFFFERFRFCAHARSRTRPYENEPDFPRKRRERAHTGTDRQMRRSNRQRGVGSVTNASLFADGTLSFREICFSASSGCRLAFCAKNADGSRVRRSRRHGKNCRSRRARRLRKA